MDIEPSTPQRKVNEMNTFTLRISTPRASAPAVVVPKIITGSGRGRGRGRGTGREKGLSVPLVPQILPTNNESSPNIPPHSEHDSSPQNDAVAEIGNRDQSIHLSPVISNYEQAHESQQSDINRKLLEERDMILEDCNKYKKEITILRAAMEDEHLIRKAFVHKN